MRNEPRESRSRTTQGEWKALLAPETEAGTADRVIAYAVIVMDPDGNFELHTNVMDPGLRELLDAVMPGPGSENEEKAGA